MSAALEGGELSAARPGRTLPPGKTRYPFYRGLGGPQGRSGRAENLVPTGILSRTVQPVVSRYTDWATRPTLRTVNMRNWNQKCSSETTWGNGENYNMEKFIILLQFICHGRYLYKHLYSTCNTRLRRWAQILDGNVDQMKLIQTIIQWCALAAVNWQ